MLRLRCSTARSGAALLREAIAPGGADRRQVCRLFEREGCHGQKACREVPACAAGGYPRGDDDGRAPTCVAGRSCRARRHPFPARARSGALKRASDRLRRAPHRGACSSRSTARNCRSSLHGRFQADRTVSRPRPIPWPPLNQPEACSHAERTVRTSPRRVPPEASNPGRRPRTAETASGRRFSFAAQPMVLLDDPCARGSNFPLRPEYRQVAGTVGVRRFQCSPHGPASSVRSVAQPG